jgi:REP element-mobilizing transposase RayT
MARPLRIEYAGALYHVFARGNNRADIFLDDVDRKAFLSNLGRVCANFRWSIRAWCLMNNHYHLLVETPEPNLSVGMRELNGVYAQQFNRRHERVGHVLQGRYKAALVEKHGYMLTLLRYIVLNPVRANFTQTAAGWPWSSHRSLIGSADTPPWLAANQTLVLFHHDRSHAIRAYAGFVDDVLRDPDPVFEMCRPGFVGSEAFVERILEQIDRDRISSEVPRAARPAPTLESIVNSARDREETIRRAFATRAYTQTEIARHLGLHPSTVSRIVRR